MQFFQYGNEGYKSILDPRTKLLLLVVINIVILGTGFSGTDFILRIACSAVPFVLFLVIRRFRTALFYGAVCVVMFLAEGIVIPSTRGTLNMIVVITLGPFSRILVGYAFAYYMMCSTTVSEFMTAMKRMRVPDQISIPLSVMFRFFPTLAETGARGLRSLHRVPLTGGTAAEALPDAETLVCRDFDFHYKNSDNGIAFAEKRFRRGAVSAIAGRNGAGKSTFARVLCGLERKAKGTVRFDGREWPVKKRAALCYMIMQDVNHQLFTDSVLEEVMLSMPVRIPEAQRKERALAVLEQLDLLPLADTHPVALSGGQKQRVAIAGGVVSDNPVLLFDEPTSGLDAKHMKQVAELLRLLKREGRTVLVITHDTKLVREVADEVVSFS